MVVATMLFSVSSAFAKWQVALYPVGEVMFMRSFSSLVVCAAFVLPFTGLSVFATHRPRDHIARGLSQSISQTFSVIAFSMMPLAGAVAINFSAPLWSALLSVVWLKERAGPVRWLVLLAGFLGVLIVTNPGADSLQVGALFALGNAIMYGSVTVVRGMTATELANTLLMWQMVTIAFFHALLLLFGFRMPAPVDAAMLVCSGIANAIAQFFWTRALHLAPAPSTYREMPAGFGQAPAQPGIAATGPQVRYRRRSCRGDDAPRSVKVTPSRHPLLLAIGSLRRQR